MECNQIMAYYMYIPFTAGALCIIFRKVVAPFHGRIEAHGSSKR